MAALQRARRRGMTQFEAFLDRSRISAASGSRPSCASSPVAAHATNKVLKRG
jgi:hypothetical protein